VATAPPPQVVAKLSVTVLGVSPAGKLLAVTVEELTPERPVLGNAEAARVTPLVIARALVGVIIAAPANASTTASPAKRLENLRMEAIKNLRRIPARAVRPVPTIIKGSGSGTGGGPDPALVAVMYAKSESVSPVGSLIVVEKVGLIVTTLLSLNVRDVSRKVPVSTADVAPVKFSAVPSNERGSSESDAKGSEEAEKRTLAPS